MRLAFMGTPEFALPTLKALILEKSHEVSIVITQPDKPKGRGRQLQMPPVKLLALEHGIPVFQPRKLKENPEILEAVKKENLDAVIVVAYGKMIPDKMLGLPKHGFVNVHASLLPRFRGAAPINRAIIEGCTVTGVSIMQIDSGMDSGPVFLEAKAPITDEDDAISLSHRLSELGAEKLLEALTLLGQGNIKAVPQRHEEATYAPMLAKEEGEIDWGKDPKTIHNMIRGLVPWPCAYTYLEAKILKILRSRYELGTHDRPVGTMLKDGQGLKIACSGGFIVPENLQLEGKKAMDGHAFSVGLHAREMMLGRM